MMDPLPFTPPIGKEEEESPPSTPIFVSMSKKRKNTEPLFITNDIVMDFKVTEIEPDASFPDEPHVHLEFRFIVYDLDEVEIINILVKSVHWFSDSSRSSLKSTIEHNETFPMEYVMSPEHADNIRESMAWFLKRLIRNMAKLPKEKRLKSLLQAMIIIQHIKVDEQECRRLMRDHNTKPVPYHELTHEQLRMRSMVNRVYAGEGAAARGGGGGGVGDCCVCSICLEEIVVAVEFVKLPCNHKFHVQCLRSWFERADTCPLCRLSFGRILFPPSTFSSPRYHLFWNNEYTKLPSGK